MGVLLVVAGPSGAGKGTIVRRLLERDPRIWLSVSMTTRAPRPGEADRRDYLFVDRPTFESVADSDGFLEWFEVYGDLYGTPRRAVEEHLAARDVLLEVDVQGALAVGDRFPEAVLVFVRPPSREVQRTRLLGRGGHSPAEIERRLAAADHEEAQIRRFDEVVVNDDLDAAVAEVAAILSARRAASERRGGTARPHATEHDAEH